MNYSPRLPGTTPVLWLKFLEWFPVSPGQTRSTGDTPNDSDLLVFNETWKSAALPRTPGDSGAREWESCSTGDTYKYCTFNPRYKLSRWSRRGKNKKGRKAERVDGFWKLETSHSQPFESHGKLWKPWIPGSCLDNYIRFFGVNLKWGLSSGTSENHCSGIPDFLIDGIWWQAARRTECLHLYKIALHPSWQEKRSPSFSSIIFPPQCHCPAKKQSQVC